MSDTTKESISSAFLGLLDEGPYESVTIQAISERAHVSRKTVYYHFRDKADLAIHVFRSSLAERLERHLPEEGLLREGGSKADGRRAAPIFIRDPLDGRSLCAFSCALSDCLESCGGLLRQLCLGADRGVLEDYLSQTYAPHVAMAVERQLERRGLELSRDDVESIASWYVHSVFHRRFHELVSGRLRCSIEAEALLSAQICLGAKAAAEGLAKLASR